MAPHATREQHSRPRASPSGVSPSFDRFRIDHGAAAFPFHIASLLANTAGSPPPSRPATKAEASRLATKAEAKCLPGWAGDPHVDHFRRFDSLEIVAQRATVAQSSVGKCRQQRLRPAELFLHGCFPSDCMRNSGGRFCDRPGAEQYRPRRYSPPAPVISPARTSPRHG